jgi:hypothetical protein
MEITAGAIPFYKSPVEMGLATTALAAVIAMFPKLGNLLGVHTTDDATALVKSIFGVLAFVVPIVVGIIHWRSSLRPLTVTAAAAAAHPATAAAVKIQTAVITQAMSDAQNARLQAAIDTGIAIAQNPNPFRS